MSRTTRLRTAIPTLSISDKRLSSVDHQVLAALCFLEDHKTNVATSKRNDIATMTGINERSVSRSTNRLNDLGWIIKDGQGRGIKYFINWGNNPFEDELNPDSSVPVHSIDSPAIHDNIVPVDTYNSSSNPDSNVPVVCTNSANPDISDLVSLIGNRANVASNVPDRRDEKNQGTTISSNTKKPITNKYSDQIFESDASIISFQVAVEILKTHGSPFHFNPTHENSNTDIIQSWVDAKYPVKLIKQAAMNAEASETRTTPVGPKYVNGCIQSLISKPKDKPGNKLRVPADDNEMVRWAEKELGMRASPHDSYIDFRKKVYTEIEKRKYAA